MTWHNTCTFECGQHEPLAACCISDRNSGNCRHPRELLAVFNRYSICVPDTEADCRSCRRVCADCLQQFNYPRLHLGRQLHVLQEPFWYQRGHPATAPTPPIMPMSTSPNRVPAVGCQDAYSESLWQRPPSGLACIADISDTADSQSISQALRVSHEMCIVFCFFVEALFIFVDFQVQVTLILEQQTWKVTSATLQTNILETSLCFAQNCTVFAMRRPSAFLPLAFSGLAFLVPWPSRSARSAAWNARAAAAQSRLPLRALGDSEDLCDKSGHLSHVFSFQKVMTAWSAHQVSVGEPFPYPSHEELSSLQAWMLEQGAPSSGSTSTYAHKGFTWLYTSHAYSSFRSRYSKATIVESFHSQTRCSYIESRPRDDRYIWNGSIFWSHQIAAWWSQVVFASWICQDSNTAWWLKPLLCWH